MDLVVDACDGAAEGDEFAADVGERAGSDLVGAGEAVSGDCPDFSQACSRLREYCGNRRTSAWSRRIPPSADGTLAVIGADRPASTRFDSTRYS